MASSDIITAIDIGTTKICTIVARNDRHNNIVDIIDYSFAPCEGLKKGNVEDIYLTSEAINQTLVEIKKNTGISPKIYDSH